MPLESQISKKIMDAIRKQFPSAIVRKRHVTLGTMGDPDIYGVLPGGIHFEIEVKRPGNKQTRLQVQRLSEWREAGAITGIAQTVDEAIHIIISGVEERYK